MTKISIITPSFNQCSFLEETIESILIQGYSNLEFIIIDGGSTDGSVEVIKKYEKSLSYWVSEKDDGQSDAINKGFKIATGEIIAWLNSDDIYAPGILKKLPKYFEDMSTVLVYGLNKAFGRGYKNELLYGEVKEDHEGFFLGKMAFSQPSSFFRKSVIDEVGFLDNRLHYGMDYDLVLRLFLHGDFVYYPELLSFYRFHSNSKSAGSYVNFAKDWAFSFSKLLRTFQASSLIDDLRFLGIYQDSDEQFKARKKIDYLNLEMGFWFFLNEQAQAYYGDRDLEKACEIASFINKRNPVFFKKMNIRPLLLRSRFVPKMFFKLFD